MVPGEGLEPSILAAQHFKCCVYTIPPPGQDFVKISFSLFLYDKKSDYDNWDRAQLNSLNDYRVYPHLCGAIQVEDIHLEFALPSHSFRNFLVLILR